MKFPFCKPSLSEEDVTNVVEVIRSGNLYHSSVCEKVEKAIQREFGQYPVLVNSCTAALILAFEKALAGSDSPFVIVPDMTFCSTAHAVKIAGGIPVLCDVNENGLIDIDEAVHLIKQYDTGLVAVVDLYGQLPDWSNLRKAADRDLVIIEDAAHSYGSMDKRKNKIGTHADFTCVSFYATKVITCADGGFVMTPDAEVAAEMARRANNGITSRASDRYTKKFEQYDVVEVGHKMMMNDLNAALLYHRIEVRPEWVTEEAERRIGNAEHYAAHLSGLKIKPLQRCEQILDNHHLTVWVCPSREYRDGLIAHCQQAGIQLSVHFRALSTTTIYGLSQNRQAVNAEECHRSKKLSDTIVSLPNYPSLSCADIKEISSVIRSYDEAYA